MTTPPPNPHLDHLDRLRGLHASLVAVAERHRYVVDAAANAEAVDWAIGQLTAAESIDGGE